MYKFTNSLFVAALIFLTNICCGQTVFNTAGKTIQSTEYIIEYSVGELAAITTINSTDNIITQGVLQPNVKVINPVCAVINGPFQYMANPSYDKIRLVGQHNWINSYQIFAADGKLIRSQNFYNNEVDLSNLSNGIYFIRMLPGCDGNYKTIKIFKSPK